MNKVLGLAPVLLLACCSRAPSQNILGSFFPAWMLCAGLGIIAAAACRVLFGTLSLHQHLIAPALGYGAVAAAVTLLAWLVQFGQ